MNKISWAASSVLTASAIALTAASSAPAQMTSDYTCWMDMGYGVVDLSHLCGRSGGSGGSGSSTVTNSVFPATSSQQIGGTATSGLTESGIPIRYLRHEDFLVAYNRSNPTSEYNYEQILGDAREYCRGVASLAGDNILNDGNDWVFDKVDQEASNALERESLVDHWLAIHWNAPTRFC